MRKKNKKFFSLLMAGTMAMSFLTATGCSEKKDTKVALITMGTGAKFWDVMQQGAQDACNEFDIKMEFSSPTDESSIDEQISLVQKAIDERVDAIVISPADYDLMNDVFDKAGNSGIKIISVNSDAGSDAVLTNVATDNSIGAILAGRQAMKVATEGSSVAVLSAIQGNAVIDVRINDFISTFNELAATSDSENAPKLFDNVIYTDENSVDGAKATALKIMKENPEISVIYATNESGTLGACQAVEEAGRVGQTFVVGFDSSEQIIAYLGKNILSGVIAQSPYNMGYLGVRYAKKAIDGDTTPYYVDTGAYLVTKDNVDDQTMQLILYPEKF